MIDIGLQVTRDDLRALLDMTPNLPQNDQLAASLVNLLNNQNIVGEPFTYTAPFPTLVHGAAATTFQLNIANDADFLTLLQTYTCNVANAGQTASSATYPLAKVLLTNTTTGYQYMDQAVEVPALFGTAAQPFILPQPMRITANSSLTVQATNYDAAQDYNLFLHFIGVKLKRRA